MFISRKGHALQASGVLALTLATIFGFFILTTRAEVPLPWLADAPLYLQKEANASAVPTSLNGNIDCQQENATDCVVPTSYGRVNLSSKVWLNGTDKYYPVFTQIDDRQHFMPVPNSNIGISYSPVPVYGLYLYFNHDFSTSLNAIRVDTPTGSSIEYHVNRPPDGQLQDRNGRLLPADYDSMSFSANGQWMVVTEPNAATLRVNLQTLDVIPFGHGFNYAIGSDPAPQTAITNDGRYAVLASKNFGYFRIFDLSTCGYVPASISGPVDCQYRDLQSFMWRQTTGFVNASNIRFISEDVLAFYATSSRDNVESVDKYILSASGDWHQLDYLTLGDSYISGEGAYDYLAGTDTSGNKCHVSLISYPYLLGLALNYDSFHSVACSGAVTKDITNTSSTYLGQAIPKVEKAKRPPDQISSTLANFLPGYINQLDFVSQYQPKVVTLSIGGNDMGFSSILLSCVMPGTCYSTYEDRLELVRQINDSVFAKLVDTYQQIKNAGAPDARIYVIGYPQIAKPGGDCGDNVHLDAQEIEFSVQIINYLDSVVEAAANKAGVRYVDTQNALDGHRLCEASNKYSAAVNGLTAGNDRPTQTGGPIADESYHPNFIGHQLLEQTILEATGQLTQPMPAANPISAPPNESGLAILDVPKANRSINTTEYDPGISDDVIYKQTLNKVNIDGISHALAPSSILQVQLHSDAIALGSFSTDTNGNLSAQVIIPGDVPAGFHQLHFYGVDLTGQPVDIYKTIYLADSLTDINGNGIDDSQEICVGIVTSGRDIDQDGVDDACDGFIGEPPTLQINASHPVAIASNDNSVRTNSAATNQQSNNSAPAVLGSNAKAAASTTTIPTASTQYKNLRVSSSYLVAFGVAAAGIIALVHAAKN